MLYYREREQFEDSFVVPLTMSRWTNLSWPAPAIYSLNTQRTVPKFKALTERILSDTDNDRSQWHKVEHYKCSIPSIAVPLMPRMTCESIYGAHLAYRSVGPVHPLLMMDDPYLVGKYGAYGSHTLRLPGMTLDRADGGFVPPPANLQLLIDMAVKAMLPQVKAELSLINSLIELKDFRSLPTTLKRLREWTSTLPTTASRLWKMKPSLRQIRGTFNVHLGPTMRESLRATADGYLLSEFAIRPLLSDICGMTTALRKISRQINDLIVRQGKRQLRHFSFKWTPTELAHTEEQPFVLDNGQWVGSEGSSGPNGGYYRRWAQGFYMRRVSIPGNAVFHAQMEFNYHFSKFEQENALMLGMMDALGVNLNPAIIWNAIPWTFLLDWFIGFGQWLDDRKVLNLEPQINITRFLWSIRTSRTVRLIANPYGAQHAPIFETKLPDMFEETYRRDPAFPEFTGNSLVTSGLSLKELSLGLALLTTRRFKYRKPRFTLAS